MLIERRSMEKNELFSYFFKIHQKKNFTFQNTEVNTINRQSMKKLSYLICWQGTPCSPSFMDPKHMIHTFYISF